MYIYDTAKAKSTICIAKTNNGQWGVNLNASYKLTKVNDYRFKAAVKMTGFASAHHVSTDGLQEWWITASPWSVKLSGQETQYPDEQGTAYFNSVPGKSFSISVTWTLETTTRYWSDSLAQFVTTTSSDKVSMKTLNFKSVTVKKK